MVFIINIVVSSKIRVLGPHCTKACDSVEPLDSNRDLLKKEEGFLWIFRCSGQPSAEFLDESQALLVQRSHRLYRDWSKKVSCLKLLVFVLLSSRSYFRRSSRRYSCLDQVRWRKSVYNCDIPNQGTPVVPWNQGLAIWSFPIQSGEASRFPDRRCTCPDEAA